MSFIFKPLKPHQASYLINDKLVIVDSNDIYVRVHVDGEQIFSCAPSKLMKRGHLENQVAEDIALLSRTVHDVEDVHRKAAWLDELRRFV